jgi:hypothetical protein
VTNRRLELQLLIVPLLKQNYVTRYLAFQGKKELTTTQMPVRTRAHRKLHDSAMRLAFFSKLLM